METIFEKVQRNVNEYVRKKRLRIVRELGWGMDGLVLMVEPKAAVKTFKYPEQYHRELNVYKRLHSKSVFQVLDFNIPRLIDHDDELKVIEMSVVNPPFVLDFASAYLDTPPDFPDEIQEEWYRERRELFEDRWPVVRKILSEFRKLGIYLTDVKPGNIEFDEDA